MLFPAKLRAVPFHGAARDAAGGQGPLLAGVIGRPRGPCLVRLHEGAEGLPFTWDASTLDRFLSRPGHCWCRERRCPSRSRIRDRRDVIAFLGTLGPIAPPEQRLNPATLKRVPTPGDWQNDAPGVRHRIRVEDLPAPYATQSAGNSPHIGGPAVRRRPFRPAGFQVKFSPPTLRGRGSCAPRPTATSSSRRPARGRSACCGRWTGRTRPPRTRCSRRPAGAVRHRLLSAGRAIRKWVYVANLNSVVRFPYHNGDLEARGPRGDVVPLLADSTGGHTTRDVAFSLDGQRMFISVGSGSKRRGGMPTKSPAEIRDWEAAHARAPPGATRPTRQYPRDRSRGAAGTCGYYATGIRNAVGIAVQPGTGDLWVSVNERDALGDDLVPDYITHVRRADSTAGRGTTWATTRIPRHAGERPDLAGKAIVPDVPVQSHSASLQMTFYPGGRLRARGVPGGIPRGYLRGLSTAPGTGPAAPEARSSAVLRRTAWRPASMRIS
jgi:hypothetical protein